MSLRDHFAAKALQGIVTNEALLQTCIETAVEDKQMPECVAAFRAYRFADAMLKERAR